MAVKYVRPGDLKPHPLNQRIYGNDLQLDPVFLEDIRDGIRHPLTVSADGYIVCGHRRHAAALQIGMDSIPVVAETWDHSDPECYARLVLDNSQRIRSQLAIAWELYWLKQCLGPAVMRRLGGDSNNRTSDFLAGRCGWGETKVKQAVKVIDWIVRCEERGEPQLAVVPRDLLETRSVNEAWNWVRAQENPNEPESLGAQEVEEPQEAEQDIQPSLSSTSEADDIAEADDDIDTRIDTHVDGTTEPGDAGENDPGWKSDPSLIPRYKAVRSSIGGLVRSLIALEDADIEDRQPMHREFLASLEAAANDWFTETGMEAVGF